MFGSTFQLHVCVYIQHITGTHAPKRGNGSWRGETQLLRKIKAETQIFLKQATHRFINPSGTVHGPALVQNKLLHSHSDTQHFIKLKLGLTRPVHPCASCSFLRVLFEQNHITVLKRIKIVHCLNGYFHQAESVICFFLSQLPCSMPSMLVGAPFKSSSMLCTYPRTTKPSKQRRKGTQKPITHSSLLWTSSPLWTSSSEPPLRCGHRCCRCGHHCRRCGFLHSSVRLK